MQIFFGAPRHGDHRDFYYALLRLGNATEQPGADLNGAWYLRDGKIFAKLTQIARSAGCVLVAFGFGHAYWLRHFMQQGIPALPFLISLSASRVRAVA